MEVVTESSAKQALTKLLGSEKAAQVPFNPEENPDVRLAIARRAQIDSGVIPPKGRGSAGGTTPLPEGKGWLPHVGNRQRLRELKRAWVGFEKVCKNDEWAKQARERLIELFGDHPHAEVAIMAATLGARIAAEKQRPKDLKAEWITELNRALNTWEEAKAAAEERAKAAEAKAAEEVVDAAPQA